MNILHLVSYAVMSGPLPGVLLLASAQRQAGHAVHVVHDRWRGNFSPYEEDARHHPLLRQFDAPWPFALSSKGGIGRAWFDLRLLRRLSAQGDVDIVHCHLSHEHWLASMALNDAAVCIRTVHSHPSRAMHNGLAPWMFGNTAATVVRSQFTAQALRQKLPHRHAIHIVDGAVDCDAFADGGRYPAARSRLRASLGLGKDALMLGHVALIAGRGQEELLTAFVALLQQLRGQRCDALPHLVFVGRGPHEVRLRWQASASAAAPYVHFLGYVPTPGLPELYQALDGAFVAQPGSDGAARAALEAMAANVPLIGVMGPQLQQLLHPDRAFVAERRDADAICMALLSWHNHETLRQQRSFRARAWVRSRRHPEVEARATAEVYEWALERRQGHACVVSKKKIQAPTSGRSSAW